MTPKNPESISPRDFALSVQRGYKRFDAFRANRLFALTQYTGNRYDSAGGSTGKECAGFLFNAVRVLAPLLCFENPRHLVETPYIQYKQQADLWALALTQHDKQINIRDTYARAIVDAIFCLGILKTGLAENGEPISLDADSTKVMSGEIYTENVSFDDFVADPLSKEHLFRDARWMGSKVIVPRQLLLDSGNYANDLVERLPRIGDNHKQGRKAEEISQRHVRRSDEYELEDDVEVWEIFVPSANAIITLPADPDVVFDEFLRISDYYGLKEGPYTFLALTPRSLTTQSRFPWPRNSWTSTPWPIRSWPRSSTRPSGRRMSCSSPAMARTTPSKSAMPATARSSSATPPNPNWSASAARIPQNSEAFQILANQFNVLAGNINQLGGQNVSAKSATAANILQQNNSVQVEAMRIAVYDMANEESRKRGFYMWTDPLINLPMTKRVNQPGQIVIRPKRPRHAVATDGPGYPGTLDPRCPARQFP